MRDGVMNTEQTTTTAAALSVIPYTYSCRGPAIEHRTLQPKGRRLDVRLGPLQTRVGHGLGPSMGWVGLSRVGSEFFLNFGGLGWV